MFGTARVVGALCAFMCLSFLGQAKVFAQQLVPEHFAFAVGGWELILIEDDQDEVMGFWAIPTVPVSVGNIRRMWFESMPGDQWEVWAFEPVDFTAKVGELAGAGAKQSDIEFVYYKEFKAADGAVNLDVDGQVKGPIEKGFLAGDPLAETVAAMEDPTPVIDLLADIGYPIAPGMTGMLASGAIGSGITMNPVTKQLLTCLVITARQGAGAGGSVCQECVCVRTEGPMTPGPWEVTETLLAGGRLRCEYSRVESHSYWQWGDYPTNCQSCTMGSPDDPIEYEEVVEYTEYWYDVTNCPDDPFLYP